MNNTLEQLQSRIGNTPLSELRHISIPNGNRIFAKEEYENPTGSHYDRVYLHLFSALEREHKITRGRSRLIEVSSGCAGASFAFFCQQLGYDGTVVVPKDLPKSRLDHIREYGSSLILSPAGQYMQGAVKTLQRVLVDDRKHNRHSQSRYYCVNHAHDERTLSALGPIADEVVEQLGRNPDCFVAACGNGANLIGIGRRFKELNDNTIVVACDPIEAPVAFVRRHPGEFERRTGYPPQPSAHSVYGTGGWGMAFPFLHEPRFSQTVDQAYFFASSQWQQTLNALHHSEGKAVGYSSALTLCGALAVAANTQDRTIVLPFYDSIATYK